MCLSGMLRSPNGVGDCNVDAEGVYMENRVFGRRPPQGANQNNSQGSSVNTMTHDVSSVSQSVEN
jgi:hypothetical protein